MLNVKTLGQFVRYGKCCVLTELWNICLQLIGALMIVEQFPALPTPFQWNHLHWFIQRVSFYRKYCPLQESILNVVIFCGWFLFTIFKCITKNNLYMQLYILSVFVAIYKLIIGKRLSQISIPHIIWWYFKRPYHKDPFIILRIYI